jgi:hypothetical protein
MSRGVNNRELALLFLFDNIHRQPVPYGYGLVVLYGTPEI